MKRWILPAAAALAAVFTTPAMPDEAGPLPREALARCAAQVQTLLDESGRLTQAAVAFDRRRSALDERSAALRAERDAVAEGDLEAGLAVREKLKEHHAQTLAFNASVEQLKREIGSLNALKQDYDGNCANRSYRRSDLEGLPAEQQAAMRAGLRGVQVPYIAP